MLVSCDVLACASVVDWVLLVGILDCGAAKPVRLTLYRLSHAYREEVQSELHEMLDAGITEPSKSVTSIVTYIPYSAKFSRRIIFAVLEDWFQTVKIKLAKFFECILV